MALWSTFIFTSTLKQDHYTHVLRQPQCPKSEKQSHARAYLAQSFVN